MFNNFIHSILKENYSKKIPIPWTNVYGLARSLLAFGTLATLLVHDADFLFRPLGIEQYETGNNIYLLRWSLFTMLSGENLELARWLSIVLLLFVISGWQPRITGPLHWWVSFSFASSCVIVDGGDQVTAILTLLLLPICLTDGRKWHWQQSPVKVLSNTRNKTSGFIATSSLWVIKLQVAVIYFIAATAKLSVPEWSNGTALYYWFLHPIFGFSEWLQPLFLGILVQPIGVTLLTWGVLILEIILFAGFFMAVKHRKKLLVIGLLFHFGIVVVHGLFSFFFAMSAALILYLWPLHQSFKIPLHFKKVVKVVVNNVELYLPQILKR